MRRDTQSEPERRPHSVPVEPRGAGTKEVTAEPAAVVEKPKPSFQTQEGRKLHPPTPRHTKLVKYTNVNGQELEIWE